MNEDYLEHIGVKGMKWGVRKAASRERKVKEAYNARLAVKKSAQREKKAELRSSTKNTSERKLSESEKNWLLLGGLGSLLASPVFGAGVYGGTKASNILETKRAVANILGSDISSYSKSSLKRARKTLNQYGNVEIETKKGTVSLNYDGDGTRAYQTGKT